MLCCCDHYNEMCSKSSTMSLSCVSNVGHKTWSIYLNHNTFRKRILIMCRLTLNSFYYCYCVKNDKECNDINDYDHVDDISVSSDRHTLLWMNAFLIFLATTCLQCCIFIFTKYMFVLMIFRDAFMIKTSVFILITIFCLKMYLHLALFPYL